MSDIKDVYLNVDEEKYKHDRNIITNNELENVKNKISNKVKNIVMKSKKDKISFEELEKILCKDCFKKLIDNLMI